jgi:cobalt-zinc-cadmium efflux system protein
MGAGHQGHSHANAAAGGRDSGRSLGRLGLVLALSVVYMVAEVVGGLASNSLALLADAGHMLSDAGALALSLFAMWIARRPPTARSTYGFHRTEILAALANGGLLVAAAVFIFVEAWRRLSAPPPVEAPLMMAVAAGGLAVNLIGMALLRQGRRESLNVRGAWLHLLTDALGSVQALAAGALVWAFGWRLADPLASLLIGILVVWSGAALLRETLGVLMESAPGHIDVDKVRSAILAVRGVSGVHDLHVWTITSGRESLSAHVVTRDDSARWSLLAEIRQSLHDRFGIHHVTIQVEAEDAEGSCHGCEAG